PFAGAGVVHHRAGRRAAPGAGEGRLERRRRRPVRGQRGVLLRRDGPDEGPRHSARQTQRARWRGRTGPSDRRKRCAFARHAGQCAAQARRQTRRGVAVHWWRRGNRSRDRALLSRSGAGCIYRPTNKAGKQLLDSVCPLVIMSPARGLRVADCFHLTRKTNMTFNKALLALAMGFALAACSNQQQAEDSAVEAGEAAHEAQEAAANAAATGDMMAAEAAQAAADTAASAAETAATSADAAAGATDMTAADDAADAAENAADAAEQSQDAAEEAAAGADAENNTDGE